MLNPNEPFLVLGTGLDVCCVLQKLPLNVRAQEPKRKSYLSLDTTKLLIVIIQDVSTQTLPTQNAFREKTQVKSSRRRLHT